MCVLCSFTSHFSFLLPHLPSPPPSPPLPSHYQGCWSYSCGIWYLHCQDGHWDSREVHRGQTGETLTNYGDFSTLLLPIYWTCCLSFQSTYSGETVLCVRVVSCVYHLKLIFEIHLHVHTYIFLYHAIPQALRRLFA